MIKKRPLKYYWPLLRSLKIVITRERNGQEDFSLCQRCCSSRQDSLVGEKSHHGGTLQMLLAAAGGGGGLDRIISLTFPWESQDTPTEPAHGWLRTRPLFVFIMLHKFDVGSFLSCPDQHLGTTTRRAGVSQLRTVTPSHVHKPRLVCDSRWMKHGLTCGKTSPCLLVLSLVLRLISCFKSSTVTGAGSQAGWQT